MKKLFPILLIFLSMAACDAPKKSDKRGYKTPEMTLSSDRMTPEILWAFGRLGDFSISQDQKRVLYTVTYYSKEEDRSYNDLYIYDLESGTSKQITDTDYNKSGATWGPDGKIAFMANINGSMQLWEMQADGSELKQITDIDGGIEGFLYSPDSKKLLFLKAVKLEKDIHDLHPDLPKANARLIDDQFYRHWDHWVETYTHPFIADIPATGMITNGTDIMEGEHWEAPLSPFGGVEEMTWSADNKSVIYTSRKKFGMEYAKSTNSDLYQYDLTTKGTKNLTEGMMGYDNNPVLSPDGKLLAWGSMEREGYESDKVRLFVMNMETGEKRNYSKEFDFSAENICWADNNTIFFIVDKYGTAQIHRLTVDSGEIKQITEGSHNFVSLAIADNILIAGKQSISQPTEMYKVDPTNGVFEEISFINKNLLDQLTMGKVESRWIKTTDNKEMLTQVIYPPHFDPSKKYPAILYCTGGPQNSINQFWSYRWNFQMMAANDYIVVAPNRRGTPGFGMEWQEGITCDYAGQDFQDYLTAIDELKKEPFIDEDRLGCVGASYGGFSVFEMMGRHERRFKAFIAHCGIFHLEMKYYTTEEMWFPNWDLGGAPWEKDNRVAQRSFSISPHHFVGNWDTPILVIHGQKDFRIDASQGMAGFNAARMQGIPAQYLYFPEESHWVLGCQNGILWQRTFFNWLDKWLK